MNQLIRIPLFAAAVLAAPAIASAAPAEPPQLAQCKVCHNFAAGQPNKIGPNLHGIVGKKAASTAGFAYSAALKGKAASGLVWDAKSLDTWLAKPAAFAPGTKMAYAGLADPKARAAVIAYLAGNK